MRLLAAEMGFDEPWLQQEADEVIAEVLAATAVTYPALQDITLARLKTEHTIPLQLESTVPFAGWRISRRPAARWNCSARRWPIWA